MFTSDKYRGGFWRRMGFVPNMGSGRRILVHAVSVGEFLASVPLINALNKEFPSYEIVVSTTTTTGNKVAAKMVSKNNKIVFYPLDFGLVVKHFFNRVKPSIVILVETELWPNFLKNAAARNIPVIVINGRISDRSYKHYSLFKRIFGVFAGGIARWGMQFDGDMQRLICLGIAPDRICITGSLKFDSAIQRIPEEEVKNETKSKWGLNKDTLVLAGGSTHDGEERILLDLYRDLKDNFNSMVLVIAPRHPERAGTIRAMLDARRMRYILRSQWRAEFQLSDYEVVLIDTLGELISIYGIADVVFIGKSLTKGGGQNILEPAALGKAVVCGPLMENFREITQYLLAEKGILQVSSEKELKYAVSDLLNNKEKRNMLGRNAKEAIQKASGATTRNIELIRSMEHLVEV